MCQPKPPIISQQCVVYNYKCDLCDAEYVGYTSRHLHQRIDEQRYLAICKHLKNDHGLETIGDLTNNFSDLKKCNGKLDCLIYELFFIKKIRPCLNTQSDSIRAKTIYLICHFLNAYFTFYRLARYILSYQTLFFFHLKMMTWSHRNVVSNSFRLFFSFSI